MDVVVKSRHCNLSDEFRSYVAEKITRLSKLNDRAIRVEVEVSAERNKRQHDQASRVEITLRTKGPVIRAEAAAEDKAAAFDLALDKLMAQLQSLVDAGNTVIVVEHERRVIAACDWIVEIGPGAAAAGGRIVFAGPPPASRRAAGA